MTNFISDGDRGRVNQAVQAGEARTSVEFVPVIARSSGRYDRAEDVVGLWAAGLAIVGVWLAYPLPVADPDGWHAASPVWQLLAILAAGLSAFVVGAWIGSRFDGLRRLFTPAEQMRDEVARRSRGLFFDQRVHHTAAGGGVLLYVSLYEHVAAIVADKQVLAALGQEQLDAICGELTAQLRRSSPADALCSTIAALADRLAPLLPRADHDVNELPDALVIVD